MYNETYDEYIRSILGYPPINNSFTNSYQDYRNQNIMSEDETDMELEQCYPEIYKIVYPMIKKKCSNIRTTVTNEDVENMTDEIYYALEEKNEIQLNINLNNDVRTTDIQTNASKIVDKKPDVKISQAQEHRETRQFNRNLRDLIKVLLIRELLQRRRRPRPPMPGPRPPMRPPFGPGTGRPPFNRDFEISNYDIFEY